MAAAVEVATDRGTFGGESVAVIEVATDSAVVDFAAAAAAAAAD